MKQAHVFISGQVQGVGYRYFIRDNAIKLGLTGFVRNTEDGGVEVVLQGEEKVIDQMIGICKQGPMLSTVKQIGMEWENGEQEFEDFEIR